MKVLQIVYSGIGGNSVVAFSLIQGDIKKVWNSSIVFTGKEKVPKGFVNFCKKLSIKYFNQGNQKSYFLREFYLFFKLIKQKPDIIISHNAILLSVTFFKLIYNVKVVYVDHTPYTYRNYKNIFSDILVFSFFDKIIYVNKILKKKIYLRSIQNINKEKISFIDNGVLDISNNKKNLKSSNKKIKIGMMARFSNGKRQDLLIKSLSLIKKEIKKKNITCEIVGEGDNLEFCKKLVIKLNLQKYIKFKKSVNFLEIKRWFSEISLYSHFSDDEALSTSILYAMSSKTLILASNNSGNKFLKNKNDFSALLVENKIENISKITLKLIKNLIDEKKFINRAYNLFVKKYSSVSMFNKYNLEIKKLFNEKK